jgi:ketosteroid isomerase-like protein
MSTETERFLAELLPRQRAAEQAIHNGDVEPRLALWARTDPVTVFGARMSASGWADLEPMFRTVASWFSDSSEYEFEVIAAGASGGLAYTLRATHVYRREDGQWRIVHRHADAPPAEGGTI